MREKLGWSNFGDPLAHVLGLSRGAWGALGPFVSNPNRGDRGLVIFLEQATEVLDEVA
jgi:hypothetical protein